MSNAEFIRMLARPSLFSGLSPAHIERIAGISVERTYGSHDLVFRQDEVCNTLFVVKKGAVRLCRLSSDGQETVVQDMRPGESIGETALLQQGRHLVHCMALDSPTVLIEVNGEGLMRLMDEDRSLGGALVGAICRGVTSLVERVEELSAAGAAKRLARYLVRLPSRTQADGLHIELAGSKRQLASSLRMSPETLSRILRRWREEGIVGSSRGDVQVCDARALQAVADSA